MIQDERLMFREVIVTVIVRNRVLKGYRGLIHWPSRSPDLTSLELCFFGWMESEVYRVKLDTPGELLAPILDAAARKKINVKISSDDQHAIFAHELQNVLRMTVGFSKVYLNCKKYVIYVQKNLSGKY